MKRVNILFTLLLCLSHLTWAQGSGEGYNPENPGDPNVYYTLLLEASPRMGGTVSPTSKQLGFGESVYCSASAKTGYTFSRWMIGDSVVSTDSYFTFTISDHDEVLTAYFDYTGYDPSNPGDPFSDGYRHKVTLYANPSIGGSFNSSSFYMTEGETTRVYAYPRNGYRFASWKKNGVIVSTTNPMQITMGQANLSYVATFVYDPENPGEPAPNMFNPATGELVIDDFAPGYLYEAIRTTIGGSENYALVQSIKIVGAMDEDDLGFAYRLTNCSDIDICRTSGYSEIPSYMFEEMSSLTSVALPASVNALGNNVFSGCSNLSEVICYAIAPPTVSASTFANMADGVIVKVPSSSIYLYQQAPIWNQFSFLPLDIETCSITVNLPNDASDGRYKNSTLELKNITSGHSSKYLITDRTSYTFANNIRESQYSIYVKNNSAEILGSIEEVDIDSTSITLTFDSLRQPHTISIRVTTPDGEDVTSSVIVKWTNNGQYFSSEKTLSGILEGTLLEAQIDLPQSLGVLYATPNKISHIVNNGNNVINLALLPLTKKTISGVVLDSITRQPIYGAIVGTSQLLNGKYNSSTNVKVETDGHFSMEIFDIPAEITVSANNYYPKTTSNSDTILLSSITGLSVNISFTYQPSASNIEDTQISQGYNDYENVYYSVYNVTTGQEVTNLIQRPEQIVLAEGVSLMDVLRITAHSRNNSFADVVLEATITNQETSIIVPIIELGSLHAQYSAAENNSVCGILYDSNGVFIRTSKYKGQELSMAQLPDGSYTLVTMGDSPFYKSVLHLSDLSMSGLVENVDYICDTITIQSGVISNLLIEEVPYFDESRFYYTGINTLFSVNKNQITVGHYLTLRASVDFKKEYADSISDIKLIFDLPENCNFVENSVLTEKGISGYSVENNRICVDLTSSNNQVRFCIVPTVGTTYNPSAYVRFRLKGKDVLQPIGNVSFDAENLKINLPCARTSSEIIKINGLAPSNAKVSIYDLGVKIAETRSMANGQWEINYDISQGKSYRTHSLFASVISDDGLSLNTNVEKIVYCKGTVSVKTVTMINGENNVVYDFETKNGKTKSYSFNPSITDFTFIVDFGINGDSLLSNVSIDVKTTDGYVVEIPAFYSPSKDRWIGSSNLFSSTSLPKSVNVTYDYYDFSLINDSTAFSDFLEDRLNNVIFIENRNISSNAKTYSFRDNVKGDTIIYSYYKTKYSRIKNILGQLINEGWAIKLQGVDCSLLKNKNSSIVLYMDGDSATMTGAFIIEEIKDTVGAHAPRRVIIVDEDRIRIQHTNNAMLESWDRFLLERYDYPLRLANCKIKCNAGSNDAEFQRLRQSTNQLLQIQPIKLYGALAHTANLGSAAIDRPASSIEGMIQLYQSADAAAQMLDGMNNIMDCERKYLADILAYPDNCKCNIRPMARRISSIAKFANGERQCRKGEIEEESEDDVIPTIDPSGYVYEAISSNRVEGATATAYYKEYVEDMYGDIIEKVVLWDAEEFAQENPLFTDVEGKYAWDVPQGLWQVKFEKEGYETTYSDWLPVPPPQLDVNIAMKQYRQPEVIVAHAYEQGVEVEFDKYMQPALLNTDNIVVMQNGQPIMGTIKLLDETIAYRDSSVTYATRARFVPEQPLAKQPITLIVANRVKSYADVRMQDTYQQTFDVEAEITSLTITPSTIQVPYNGTTIVTITALPAEAAKGKTIAIQMGSTMIASTYVTSCVLDDNGQAKITLTGELLGTTSLSVSISDTHLTTSAMVYVQKAEDIQETVATPEASIPSGSIVEKGTLLTLSCETPNAAIYYTKDGSDPTLSDRIQYDTPIVINENVTIQAVAEAPNMNHSLIAAFTYTIQITDQLINIPSDNNSTWKKIIRNNRLWIFRNGIWYDTFGNRILTH